MYGKSVLAEELNRILSDSLYAYIKENNLEVLGNPLPKAENDNVDIENQKEFEFSFDMALAPQFSLNLDGNTTFTEMEVQPDENFAQATVATQATGDSQANLGAFPPGVDLDPGAGRGVNHGIQEQVHQDLLHQYEVHLHEWQTRRDDGGDGMLRQVLLDVAQSHTDKVRQIAPFEIVFFDELNLPISIPLLQLLLTANGVLDTLIGLDIDKSMHAVLAHKFRAESELVLFQSASDIIRNANIQGAVSAAREDVDVVRHVDQVVFMGPRLRGDDTVLRTSRVAGARFAAA
jgi:hypothetical protein